MPLALAASAPRAPLRGYACAAYAALLSSGGTPPGPPVAASSSPRVPMSARRAAALYTASVVLTLTGAAVYAGTSPDHRGAGFVAAGAALATDATAALAWRGSLLLHRAPGPYLAAAGCARGALLLFSPRNWFLGHALLYALVASAFAAAAAARRWPLKDAEARRADAMDAVLDGVLAKAKAAGAAVPTAAAPAEAAADGAVAPTQEQSSWLARCFSAPLSPCAPLGGAASALAWTLGSRSALWAALTAAFAAELGVVAARHPPPVPAINSAQQQWRFGVAAMLLPPAACAALTFARAVAAMPPPTEAAAAKDEEAAAAQVELAAAVSLDVDVEAPAAPGAAAAAANTAAAARRTVAFFWVGTLDDNSRAALRHASAAAATWTGVGIALGFATASSIVLAFGVFAPLLAATAALLTRDSFELADVATSWRPARWNRRQRRTALWVACNVAALGGIAGIVAGDVFAARHSAAGRVLTARVRYALPGFQSLAITLGLAFAELAGSAAVQLYRQLDLRALASPLGVALLLVPAAYASGALAISRAARLSQSMAVRRSPNANMDVAVALVPALAAPGVLAYAFGMLLWRDAANWAPRPPLGAAALLAGGLAACAAAASLLTATAAPVLGGGFLFAVVLAAVACGVLAAWAANGRALPQRLAPAAAAALVCTAALGLAAGFVSDQPFRGFSVAYLNSLFLIAARAARPLQAALLPAGSAAAVTAPDIVFSPLLLPAYGWDDTAARPVPLSANVVQLLAVALGVFVWAAICAVCVSPASGGAAAAAGAACVAAAAAACAVHASTARAAAALAALSPEALARAVTAAAAAVGLVRAPDDGQQQSAMVTLGAAWEPHGGGGSSNDDDAAATVAASRADAAAAAAALGRSGWLYYGAPPPPPGPDDALGQSRAAAASALLDAHAAFGAASSRFETFAAALARLAGAAAAAERGADDARLRAFLLDVAGVAASPAEVARWGEARRAELAAARDGWMAARAAAEAEQRRRAAEEEEGRRRRTAVAAAEEERRRRVAEEEERRRREEAAAEAARAAAAAERERLRLAAEEEERHAREEAEAAAAKAERERRRLVAAAEQERLRREREEEEERRYKAEEDAALAAVAAAEAEARRQAIEEARRRRAKQQAIEEKRRQAEREKAAQAAAKEAQAKREAARLNAEAARRKAAEEVAAQAAAEERKRTEEAARKAAEEAAAARSDGLAECKAAAAALVAATKGRGPFCDPSFPADDNALYIGGKPSAGKARIPCSAWRRATANGGTLFGGSKDADAARLHQGGLGDCWFISALAVFATPGAVPALFELPPTAEGAVVVRFFRAGKWTPVVIDDRLPCYSSGKLLFACSDDVKELWAPLLEKAYAKYYGSFMNLEGGQVQDALVDLTGGAGEAVDLQGDDAALATVSGALWARVRAASAAAGGAAATSAAAAAPAKAQDARLLLACCSPSGSDTDVSSAGIVQGHAYSILSAHEVDGVRLLQLRNPWGSGAEWKGAWSDGSPEWTPRMRKRVGYNPKDEDGVFWMQCRCREDWIANYASLNVCRVFPQEMVHRVASAWTAQSGGGRFTGDNWHLNPRLLLRRTDGATGATPVYATLTQLSDQAAASATAAAGPRNRKADRQRSIRLDILREVPSERYASWTPSDWARVDKLHVSPSVSYINYRQVAHDLELPPSATGWLLVPSTHKVGETGSWVIEVYTKARTPRRR